MCPGLYTTGVEEGFRAVDLVKTVESDDLPLLWIDKRSMRWLQRLVTVSVSCTLWIT
jgi:hypothetical protein